MADIVVVLPGITGSVLRDNQGRDLWAPTAGAAARALVTLGRSLADLELRDEHADDGVTAPLMIPDLHLIPGLWKIDEYSKASAYLQRQFAVTPGKNFFAFPYGWRRDNRVAAQRLKEQSDRWLWEWRRESPEARLILVGHSMGGLVARYIGVDRCGRRTNEGLLKVADIPDQCGRAPPQCVDGELEIRPSNYLRIAAYSTALELAQPAPAHTNSCYI